MGLFSKRTKTTPSDPFFDALVGMTSNDPNVFVSAATLQNSDVFAAISIIAGDLASNPIKSGSGLYDRMINIAPNQIMDGYHLKYALAVEMLLNGNSYAEIDFSTHSLNFIPNSQMTVLQDDQTQAIRYKHTLPGQPGRFIDPAQVLHFKYFTQDGVTGISPLYALKDEQQIQRAGNRLMAGFFSQGIHGTTVINIKQADLSDESKSNIRNTFEQQTTGDHALSTIVTDDSMSISNLSLNTDILKLVNSNDWTTRQIAKAFGLPPERLGVENEHSNQDQSNVQYLQGTLQHYEDCFTAELNYKLPQTFEFDNSRLLSLDPEAQQQQAMTGYTNGLFTRNEARKMMNLPPVMGGDDFIPTQGGQAQNGQAIDDGRQINDASTNDARANGQQ